MFEAQGRQAGREGVVVEVSDWSLAFIRCSLHFYTSKHFLGSKMCSRTDQTKRTEENPMSKLQGRISYSEVKFGEIWGFPLSAPRAGGTLPASDQGCFCTGPGDPEAGTQSQSHPRSTASDWVRVVLASGRRHFIQTHSDSRRKRSNSGQSAAMGGQTREQGPPEADARVSLGKAPDMGCRTACKCKLSPA